VQDHAVDDDFCEVVITERDVDRLECLTACGPTVTLLR